MADQAFTVLVAEPAPLVFDARGLPGLAGPQQRLLGLDELRRLLLDKAITGDAVDAVWRRLTEQARTWGPQWVIGAVGVAAPALTRMAAELSAGRRHRAEDIDSEVLAGFLHALRHAALDPPRLWLRLTWAAWRAGEAAGRGHDVSALPDEMPGTSTTPHAPYGHPDLVLGRAVTAGILTTTEAALIGDTRLGDALIDTLADHHGVSAPVLRMRRVRAERKLVAAIHRGDLTVTPRPTAATVTAGSAGHQTPVATHGHTVTGSRHRPPSV